MIVSRRRKWRRLSLGLLVLVLVATLTLLSHLWTSAPGGQKELLRQNDLNPEAVPRHDDIDRTDPRHDNEHAAVSRLDDNQLHAGDNKNAVPQDDKNPVPLDDDKNAVTQDIKNAVPLDDKQPTAEPQDKNRKPQDDSQPVAVPPDGNEIAEPLEDSQSDGVRPDHKTPDTALPKENKNSASQLDNSKPAIPQDKIVPDSVSKDVYQPDEVVLHEKRTDFKSQHDHMSFQSENGAKNPLMADLSRVDPRVNLFRPGSAGENADDNDIPELVPEFPIKPNLSAEEFVGKREEKELEDESPLPNLPRNKIENVDSSAGVGSFQSPVQVSSGKGINNTNTSSGNEDVQKTLDENNVHAAANDKKTETGHVLFPPSTSEKIQGLESKLYQDSSNQVLNEDRYFQNSTFHLEKGSKAVGQKSGKDSFLSDVRNEMNRNDFAADADQNVDVPLPTKSTFSKTNGNTWRAGPNSTDEFDSGIKFIRQNFSNIPGSIGSGAGIRIVSMSLYGSEPRYTMGAIRNAELVKENFPGWTLRIYMESPASSTPRFGLVPRNIVEKLRSLGVDIHYIVPEQDFIPPMMWRFLVADDLSVDYFIIRDSDSRLTERDAAAVSAWIRSGKPFHSIRDHPSHASYAVSGGLWGGRTKELRDILRRSWIDLMRGTSSNYLEDMNFLNGVIWPRIQFHAYCSDSVSCDRWPNSYPFPVTRYGYDHVGQVFNEHDLGRPVDIRILRAAGENSRCIATDGS